MNETNTEILLPPHDAHHDVAFYLDTTFWAGMSFVLAIVIIAKPVGKAIGGLFNKSIQNIKNTISDAEKLEIDAKELLKKYEKNLAKIDEETKSIIENNAKEIEFIKKSSVEKLEKEMKIKKEETKKMLSSMQIRMKNDINNIIIKNILAATKESLNQKLDDKKQDDLINASIDNISKMKKA